MCNGDNAMSNYKPSYGDAVVSLSNGKALGGPTDGPVTEWQFAKGATPPVEEDIQAKLIELVAEWTAQEYARNRAAAYDSIGNQLDMLMKDMRDGTTTHQESCEAVKAKFPK